MMGAFIIAGLVFVITVVLSVLTLFGDAMNDTRGDGGTSAGWVLGIGTICAALIAASHWMPNVGW